MQGDVCPTCKCDCFKRLKFEFLAAVEESKTSPPTAASNKQQQAATSSTGEQLSQHHSRGGLVSREPRQLLLKSFEVYVLNYCTKLSANFATKKSATAATQQHIISSCGTAQCRRNVSCPLPCCCPACPWLPSAAHCPLLTAHYCSGGIIGRGWSLLLCRRAPCLCGVQQPAAGQQQ